LVVDVDELDRAVIVQFSSVVHAVVVYNMR